MTVNTISSIAEFDTNGVTTNFPFYFKFLANEDLVVTYVDPLGVSSTLTLGTHYTVNGAGNDQGGSIVTTSALAGPGQLVVSREMEAFQQTSLRNQGKFLAEVHEDVFDKLTMLIQQGLATFTRALKRPLGRDYFFAENRRITSVKDPEEPQDAATKSSVEQYVGSVLSAIQGPINNSANVLYVRPSGTPGVVQDLATGEGYDYVGATLPTGVFSTVKGFFNWILDRITLSTSGSASIVAAVAKGGKVVIKNGGHYMSATAQCDYGVEPIVGFPGHESKRFDVAGETMGGTILSVQHSGYALVFSGSYLPDPPHVTQNVAGFDSVSNLTLVGASVTAPNTTDTGGFGLLVRKKAYTSIRRIAALNLRIGLHLDGVLSSTVEDYTIEGCYVGAVFEDFNSFSGPNGMHFRRIKIGGSTDLALRSDIGAAMNFDNLTIENCGVMPSSRFVATFINQPGQWAGAVNYMSSYCENNAGYADYNFENNSTHPLVINMNGSMFQRNSPSRYTGVNIRLNSVGGGRVTMKIGTTSFLSSLGYVPSASRPFFIVGANCEVIWDESCAFSETTSLAYWLCLHRAYSFSVAADGTILSGPDGFACTALGGGIYRFYRTSGLSEFAKFADDYSIHPSSTDVNVYISVVSNKTPSYFDITMSNNVTGVNAKFDVTIRRNKGYYS